MSGTSGDSKHDHAGASDDFLTQVRSLKEAEKGAARDVDSARSKASEIEAQARERAVETANQASEKAVGIKNDILAKSREHAEGEAKEILSEAKKQAEKMKAKRLPDKDITSLASSVI